MTQARESTVGMKAAFQRWVNKSGLNNPTTDNQGIQSPPRLMPYPDIEIYNSVLVSPMANATARKPRGHGGYLNQSSGNPVIFAGSANIRLTGSIQAPRVVPTDISGTLAPSNPAARVSGLAEDGATVLVDSAFGYQADPSATVFGTRAAAAADLVSMGGLIPHRFTMAPTFRTSDLRETDLGEGVSAGAYRRGLMGASPGCTVDPIGLILETQTLEPSRRLSAIDWASTLSGVQGIAPSQGPMSAVVSPSQEQAAAREATQTELQRKSLFAELEADFAAEPFEDGMDHEAEQTLAKAFKNVNTQQLLLWLTDFCTDISIPNFAGSVLRCLGRLDTPGTEDWRIHLITEVLSNGNAEMRDAATQTVEQWGDQNLSSVLKSHCEELPWLEEYIKGVIEDLEG